MRKPKTEYEKQQFKEICNNCFIWNKLARGAYKCAVIGYCPARPKK